MSVCAKFKGCTAKTVGVGFLRVKGFFLKNHYFQISPHDCQFNDTDFKLGQHVKEWYRTYYKWQSLGKYLRRYLPFNVKIW